MGLHTSLNHTAIFLSGWSFFFFLFNQIKSHSSFAVVFVASLPRRIATSTVDDNFVDRSGGSSTRYECFGKGSPVFSRVTAHYYSCHRKREFHAHIPDSSDGTRVIFTNFCPLKMTYWYRSRQFFLKGPFIAPGPYHMTIYLEVLIIFWYGLRTIFTSTVLCTHFAQTLF